MYEKNADEKMLIASTTKIMTAIACIENAKLDDTVRINDSHCNIEGSSMHLKSGESYTVKELLLGLMLASGNDAALAIAEHVSGDTKSFAQLMNAKAKSIGMDNSNFVNPHGLDARQHYSTARDMAKLMLYCMNNDVFREITATKQTDIKGESHTNHNKLLSTYKGCVGGKTGFTVAAGRCLVSCCERDGMRLVCVTLSDPDDWRDHTYLYDYAFEKYTLKDVGEEIKFQLPIISGSQTIVELKPENDLSVLLASDDKITVKAEIPPYVFAPVKKGDAAGKIYVIINEKLVGEFTLVYTKDIVMAYPCLNRTAMKGAF